MNNLSITLVNKPNPEKVTELIQKLTAETLTVPQKKLVREAIADDIARYCPRSVFLDYWHYIEIEEDRDKLIAELVEELLQEVEE